MTPPTRPPAPPALSAKGWTPLLAVSLCAAGLAGPAGAQAAVFPVTTTADVGDATPDGACNSGPGGTCPLREAVQESSSPLNAGDDTIDLPPGTYSFAVGAQPLTEAAGNGKLTILGGTARDTTIDGAEQATIFAVPAGGSLELRELTLRDGLTDLAADPKLGPLQDNGGQTDTFALPAGSAALDAGARAGACAASAAGRRRGTAGRQAAGAGFWCGRSSATARRAATASRSPDASWYAAAPARCGRAAIACGSRLWTGPATVRCPR